MLEIPDIPLFTLAFMLAAYVAVGACAIGGGIFGSSYASAGGVDAVISVDVSVPGCPPRPEAFLHGILTAIERNPDRNAAGGQTHAV